MCLCRIFRSRCKSTGKSRDPFSPILNLFLVFGIDFHPKPSRKRTLCLAVTQSLAVFCWGLVFLLLASYCKYTVKYLDAKSYAKLRFVRVLEMLDSFCIFYVVSRSRRQISNVVHEIANLGRSFLLVPSGFARSSALTAILVQFLICFSVLHPYDAGRYRNIFKQFTFGALTPSESTVRLVLVAGFNILIGLVEIFPFCVILLYATVCRYLRRILDRYAQTLEGMDKIVVAANGRLLDDCFRRYDSVLAALERFEDAMSLPVFLVSTMTFSGILFGILVLEGGHNLSYLPLHGTAVIATSCFGSFALMACLASEVNEGDRRVRRAHHRLLKRLLPGANFLRLDDRLSFLIANRDPAFALTGWGFFQFTKGFLLGATGCVFTYAFFIANL